MTRSIINLLFVSSIILTGCSENKKESTLKNNNQKNQVSEEILKDKEEKLIEVKADLDQKI